MAREFASTFPCSPTESVTPAAVHAFQDETPIGPNGGCSQCYADPCSCEVVTTEAAAAPPPLDLEPIRQAARDARRIGRTGMVDWVRIAHDLETLITEVDRLRSLHAAHEHSLSLKDALDWIAQRLPEYLDIIDPSAEANDEWNNGYRAANRAAQELVVAVRDDRLCPCCGCLEHRKNKPGISLAKLLHRDEPPVHAAPAGARLRELASQGARHRHFKACFDSEGQLRPLSRRDGHVWVGGGIDHGFAACPHPDCLLVRSAPAPVVADGALRALVDEMVPLLSWLITDGHRSANQFVVLHQKLEA